jgi:ribonuclease HII
MIGVDEVGRGCLAGPLLVVAARADKALPPGLRDSKKLSKIQRQKMLDLLSICCSFGEGWVRTAEINRLGLTKATKLGVARALRALGAEADMRIIIDGHINYCPKKYVDVQAVVDGDDLVPIVSAASIYAKVTRDAYMARISRRYAGYGFENHVGYGTKAHLAALEKFGPIAGFHRMNYAPLKGYTL